MALLVKIVKQVSTLLCLLISNSVEGIISTLFLTFPDIDDCVGVDCKNEGT